MKKSLDPRDLLPETWKKVVSWLLKAWAAGALVLTLTWCDQAPVDIEKNYLKDNTPKTELVDKVKEYSKYHKIKPLTKQEYTEIKKEWDYLLYVLKWVKDLKHKVIIVEADTKQDAVWNNEFAKYGFDTSLKVNPVFSIPETSIFGSDNKKQKKDAINYAPFYGTIKYMDTNKLFASNYTTQHSYVNYNEDTKWDKKPIIKDDTKPFFIFTDKNRLWWNKTIDPSKEVANISYLTKDDFPSKEIFKWNDTYPSTRNGIVLVTQWKQMNADLVEVLKAYQKAWINIIQVDLPTNIDLNDANFKKFEKELQEKIAKQQVEQTKDNNTTEHHAHGGGGSWWIYHYLNSGGGYHSPSYTNTSYHVPTSHTPVPVHYSPIISKYTPAKTTEIVWAKNFTAIKNPKSPIYKSVSRSSFRWAVRWG